MVFVIPYDIGNPSRQIDFFLPPRRPIASAKSGNEPLPVRTILQRWKPVFLWLPIETLIQEKQEGYYKALNESNSLNECTPFVTFMLEVIRDALAEIMQNQKAFIPTNDGINVGIKTADDVGINRDAVIKILKKQPHSTAKSLAEAMNLSPRQVERVLAELKKEGKIVRKGSNKSGWWEVN